MLATEQDSPEIVKLLLSDPRTDPNLTDSEGNTCLHIAASRNLTGCVHSLISCASCNINATNQKNRTPLHSAVIVGSKGVTCQLIIRPDCDPNIQDTSVSFFFMEKLHFIMPS